MDETGQAVLRVAVELASAEAAEAVLERAVHAEPGPPARVFCLSEAVTARGLRFAARLPFEIGERLRVRFRLPTDPPALVSGTAVVERNGGRPSEVALALDRGKEALERYISDEIG
jgi:hypothetical protein